MNYRPDLGELPDNEPDDEKKAHQMSNQTKDKPFCHSDSDGDCDWQNCPQLRDGEPIKTGRNCPLPHKPGPFNGYYDED